MLSKIKDLARSLMNLEQRSKGAVPPSPLVIVDAAMSGARKLLKTAMPPSEQRLTGKLARDGGLRVRDTRIRPYGGYPAHGAFEWALQLGPVMGRLFRTGAEGAPQTLSKEFAAKWAAYCATKHALLLPHGTDALKVALAAALDHDGMDYGGEIIVPNLGFIASVNSALDRRFGVALVDVDPATLNVDPKKVEEAIIPGKTRAIMAVHLFGQPADMKALRDIAQRHSLILIEDAAQAHGSIHELGRSGSIGDVAAFSFQSSKNLSSGEGGIMTTSSAAIFERADCIHNVGRAHVGAQRWMHETLGWNLRPSEYVAAVLLHRSQKVEEEQQTRFDRFNLLRKSLAGVSCVEPLGIGPGVVRHSVYMFAMRYHPENCGGLSIEDFMATVGAEGIPIYRGYTETLAQQPVLQRLAEEHPDYLRVLPTPVSDQAVKEIIYLPHPLFLGPEQDILEVAAAFRKVQTHYAPETLKSEATATSTPAASFAELQKTAEAPAVKKLRFGIIGFGSMGREHAAALAKLKGAELVGVSDQQPQAKIAAEEFNCTFYNSAENLIHSGTIDAVVIATPHWQHPALAIAALRAGLHVICEKPLTVTIEQADEVVEAAKKSDRLFAVVLQYRLQPAYQKVKELLDSGELGAIYRCDIVEAGWRTGAYYKSSPWRGTWKGEGGGVLLNQAPHVLDRYAWLCGMPSSLTAFCETTFHDIEVEDASSALLRHANGALGYLHVSTNESPYVSRTTISCDRGRIIVENNKVTVIKLKNSIREETANNPQVWGSIDSQTKEFLLSQSENIPTLLGLFYEDFLSAASGKTPFSISAEDGRNAVELANAMMLSSHLHREVTLPLDRRQYSEFIDSKLKGNATVQPTSVSNPIAAG